MSKEAEINLTFLIVAIGTRNDLNAYMDLIEHIISDDLKGHIIDIHYINSNLNYIKPYVKTSCDTNKANVIIIVGENKFMESETILKLIKEVVDTIFHEKISSLISNLHENLLKSVPKGLCGIRNKTVVLNIFGLCLLASIFLKTNAEKLLKVVETIKEDDKTNNNAHLKCTSIIPSSILNRMECMASNFMNDSIPIISVQKAIHKIGEVILKYNESRKVESKHISVHEAYGKVLLNDVHAPCDVPPYRTAAKYGYAIIADDEENTKEIIFPGTASLISGRCMQVKTGERIPNEATAIVQKENTKQISTYINVNEEKHISGIKIEILKQPIDGENINSIGYEIKKKEKILNKSTLIGPAEIGLLTYCGINTVEVVKNESVGVVSIGNALEEPENPLKPNRMYDDCKLMLITLLKQNNFDLQDYGIIHDKSLRIVNILHDAIEKLNIIVIIGSSHDNDILKPILRAFFNAKIHFGRVNMTPGKYTTYATCIYKERMKHFLCLQSNSALIPIAAHLFLMPLLNLSRCFHKQWPLIVARIKLEITLHSRPKYVWTSLKWDKEIYPWIHEITNHYTHNSNALIRLPPRSMDASKLLSDAFITTIFVGSK